MSLFEKIREHRVIVIIVICFVVIGSVFMLFFKNNSEEMILPDYNQDNRINENEISPSPENELHSVKIIQVDVKGAVLKPGVYELEDGLRINDVLKLAGGVLNEADLLQINLAAFLRDGQVIYIPMLGEEESTWTERNESSSNSIRQETSLININIASIEELDSLPGIGPSKAQSIIDYREEHGDFTDVKQLVNVTGIGEKTLEKLLPLIRVR